MPLAGRPLYRYSVDAAQFAGAQQIILSTDIPEVLAAHHPQGVDVLQRPQDLCGGSVPMAPVLLHAVLTAGISGAVVLLQPTSPLRSPGDIIAALSVLITGDYEMVMSVTQADRGVLKWGMLVGQRFIPMSNPDYCFANRQDLPSVYKPNGAVFAMQAEWFVITKSFSSELIGTHVMPAERSVDIDSLADFQRCASLLASPPS